MAAKKTKKKSEFKLAIVLKIEGDDADDACDVIDRILDGGAIQNVVNHHSQSEDKPRFRITQASVEHYVESKSS